jgi:D-alanyl-D-alanine carboxypeptidase (penicillin-binding protein 5/6)
LYSSFENDIAHNALKEAPSSAIRFSNASSLLDYGFSNYSYKSFGTKGEVVKSVTVTKGVSTKVNAIYETSPSFLIKKGEESSIIYELNLNDSIQAPITQGQQLGTIKYSLNGIELYTVNLVAEISIEKIGLLNITKNIFNNWFNLLRI